MIKKVAELVIGYVASVGVKHVFMLPGGGSMHLVDALGRCRELSFVVNLHEQACAVAADAYGQYTNSLGVALVTTGPGGTNTVTGVSAAWLDSTPSLFISGQVKRDDLKGASSVRQLGFQEIDIVTVVRSITKYAVTVLDPQDILFELEKAVFLAQNGRPGPVWIDIPLDVQGALVEEATLPRFKPPSASPTPRLESDVRTVIELIAGAQRPAVLVGNGVRLGRAERLLPEALDALGIPILTTWKALDLIPDDHPLYMGRPGAVAQRGANLIQQTADVLLTIGARLDLGQTAYTHEHFAPRASKVVVDIDAAELAKLRMPNTIAIQADAKAFLSELVRQRSGSTQGRCDPWIQQCLSWKAAFPVVLPEYWNFDDGVSLYVLVDVLSSLMRDGDIFAPGSSGACSEVSMQAFRVQRGVRVLNSQGLGSMGLGIPAAIGACLASGGRRTVTVDGDGGFWMNIQELETVRRLSLPTKFFVLNNKGYASIRATQTTHFEGLLVGSDPSSGLTLPDVRTVSAAFGIRTSRIASHDDIQEAVRTVLVEDGPSVCEVLVSPQQATAPRVSSTRSPDGRMTTRPMEDLWPFLPPEELETIIGEATKRRN